MIWYLSIYFFENFTYFTKKNIIFIWSSYIAILYVYTHVCSQRVQASSGDFCQQNEWSQVVVTKSGSTAKLFINGIRRSQDTSAVNPNAPTSNFIPTMIGVERIGSTAAINRAFPGRLALIRASNTAATEEQVLKMYNEEKQLFLENSKCTLVGTSNSVNAVAHDDTTKILHVGTGSGRSDFRGLERINSTTTAVSNAISASNGLVAEQ